MCKTCKGEGGLAIDNGYYLQFIPCPDNHCNFVRDDSDIEKLKEAVGMEEAAV